MAKAHPAFLTLCGCTTENKRVSKGAEDIEKGERGRKGGDSAGFARPGRAVQFNLIPHAQEGCVFVCVCVCVCVCDIVLSYFMKDLHFFHFAGLSYCRLSILSRAFIHC